MARAAETSWATRPVTGSATPAARAADSAMPMSLWCRSIRKPGVNSRPSIVDAFRSRMRFPARPPASTSSPRSPSTPDASSSTIASLTSAMIPATISWLAAFTVWPAP